MNLRIFDDVDALLRSAARTIQQQVQGGARTIALSGGNTPQPLYRMLGESDFLRATPVTWVVVDERYVPIDDPQSNAGMIQRTLFARGLPERQRFLRFRTELGDPARTAEEFEREWKAMKIERLDLVLLGMGDDGHTASLFPGTGVLQVEDRIAAAVHVPRLNAWRVTLTRNVLRDAGLRMVLAAGEGKRPVLQQVRAGGALPIATVTAGVETWWFVDRAAAPAESAAT